MIDVNSTQPHAEKEVPDAEATNIVCSNDNEETNSMTPRKLWHKDHIVWLFVLILGIYDYYTDIQVVLVFKNASSVCPQFECDVIKPQFTRDNTWMVLLIFSSIGFAAGLVLKIMEFQRYYVLYRHPLSNEKELTIAEFNKFKLTVRIGWIPLILEDIISIFLIWLALFNGFNNVKGAKAIYYRSMLIGICATLVSWIKNSWKVYKYHVKHKLTFDNCSWKMYRHCWVTFFAMIYLIFGIMFVGTIFDSSNDIFNVPILVDIHGSEYHHNNYVSWESGCDRYDENFEGIYGYGIVSKPNLIDEHSYGDDFDFDCSCDVSQPLSDHTLNCRLIWIIRGYNFLDNEYQSGSCDFDIEFGPSFCGNFTIDCLGNTTFYDGDAITYICIEQCVW